jgi:hypothetical protein
VCVMHFVSWLPRGKFLFADLGKMGSHRFQEIEERELFGPIPLTCSLLPVVYYGKNLSPGDELIPKDTNVAPKIEIDKEYKFHHLLMVDPDAPSRETHTFRSWLHWLVVNISNENVSSGETAMGTGLHRYIFAVFTTDKKIHVQHPKERGKFNVKEFIHSNSLGSPVSCNYFVAKHE